MPTITFNAFSFLQKKLKEKNIAYANVIMKIKPGMSAKDLVSQMGLTKMDVEVVFINGRIKPLDTIFQDKDRVAFIPPGGTPGPYRVFLGFKNKKNTL